MHSGYMYHNIIILPVETLPYYPDWTNLTNGWTSICQGPQFWSPHHLKKDGFFFWWLWCIVLEYWDNITLPRRAHEVYQDTITHTMIVLSLWYVTPDTQMNHRKVHRTHSMRGTTDLHSGVIAYGFQYKKGCLMSTRSRGLQPTWYPLYRDRGAHVHVGMYHGRALRLFTTHTS